VAIINYTKRMSSQKSTYRNKPYISGKELEYVTRAISAGKIASDGHFTKSCASLLEKTFGRAPLDELLKALIVLNSLPDR